MQLITLEERRPDYKAQANESDGEGGQCSPIVDTGWRSPRNDQDVIRNGKRKDV